jgi:hypothetical protein
MAKTYTSTLQVRCWKQHICQGCGANYSYLLQRKAVGTDGTAERARKNMQKRIEYITQSDTDMQPCPTCGMYQYDMIGQRRARSRLQFFWIALIAISTVLILRACYAMQATTLTWIAGAVSGFVILAQLLLETSNANRNLDANKQKADQLVAAGTLRHTPAAQNLSLTNQLATPSRSIQHLLGLALLLFSFVLVIAPTAGITVLHWPVNNQCYPPVVGPTDTTRIYLPGKISSVKGYWRGQPAVKVSYPGGPEDGEEAQASTNQNNWGSTISDVKSSEESSTSHPWVEVTMPETAKLAGKAVHCEIDLSLEFPQMSGGSSFTTQSDEMKHSLDITLAQRGAGSLYNTLWWGGTAGGGALALFASLVLYSQAKSLRKRANPTQVFTAEPAGA